MKSSLNKLGFLVLFGALLFLSPTWAQDPTGRIVGTVTDPGGAAVPDAKVTITNLKTGIVSTAGTDKEGFYQVLALPIGTYRVTIDHAGFRKVVFDDQLLQINQTLRVDARLEIGATTEVVQVEAQASVVETSSPTIEQSVTGRALTDAPLNGRNVLDLALTLPGVTPHNADDTSQGTYNIAGGRSDSVTFLLNGGSNNDLLGNGVVFNPNPDTVAEFRLLKSDYTAEYGRNGGGVVSVVTKSGANEWHGSAFDFARNDAFDANLFFNKNDPNNLLPRPILKRHQFGGTFGGPITVPHVVHGKDRFFFFFGYEGERQNQSETQSGVTTFTPAELGGDFSHSGANGLSPTGPDPAVACFLSGLNHNNSNQVNNQDGSSCGGPAHSSFSSSNANAYNAIIDPTKFNAASQKYIAAGLLPTSSVGSLNSQAPARFKYDQYSLRTDFDFTQKDRLSVTLGRQTQTQVRNYVQADVNGFPNNYGRNTYFAGISYTRSFSSNLLNEFRFNTQRVNRLNGFPDAQLPGAAALGVGITPDNPAAGPPIINFDTGLSIGFSPNGPTTEIDNTFAHADVLSWTRGHHTWKFGGGFANAQNNTVYDYYVAGYFNFQGSNGIGSGNSFADFLMGLPHDYFQSPAAPSNVRTKFSHVFAQDEWRATKKLTLTLGVRYEYSTPKLDTKGRSFSLIPGQQSTAFTKAPVSLVFPGDANAPKGTNFPDKNNFAPRLGIAWDPRGDGKTSIRAGFGMFYDVLKGEDSLQFNGQPPFFAISAFGFGSSGGPESSVCLPPNDCLGAPFAAVGVTNAFPSKPPNPNIDFGAAGFLPYNAGGSIYYVDPHLKTPYTYQYNLSVQREMARNTLIEIGYLGSSSHGLTTLLDANPTVLGTYDHKLNLLPGNVSCPLAQASCTDLSGNTIFTSLASSVEFKNQTKASYNGLEASFQKQVSDTKYLGRSYFQLGYTFAHSIDNTSGFRNRNSQVPAYQPNLFRASSDFDIKHRITFSGGWDLPFDHLWSSGPKRLLGGWSLYPVFSWRTGFPRDVFSSIFTSSNLNPGPSGAGDPFLVHANLIGPIQTYDPHHTQTLTSQQSGSNTGNFYFNPASFSTDQNQSDPAVLCTAPAAGTFPTDNQAVNCPNLRTYGTLPRNFFRGPGRTNLDLSFAKVTPLYGERLKLEIRGDFFNIFNHAEWNDPSTNIVSSHFGQITSTAPQRIIQLAARLSF
jgi:hypothetical protein